jgi:hypothetical protein
MFGGLQVGKVTMAVEDKYEGVLHLGSQAEDNNVLPQISSISQNFIQDLITEPMQGSHEHSNEPVQKRLEFFD